MNIPFKNIILSLSAMILLASCQGTCPLRPKTSTVGNHSLSHQQPVTFKNMIRQFRFDPSAIYHDAFVNKSWH